MEIEVNWDSANPWVGRRQALSTDGVSLIKAVATLSDSSTDAILATLRLGGVSAALKLALAIQTNLEEQEEEQCNT
jgi:hypothetical protein